MNREFILNKFVRLLKKIPPQRDSYWTVFPLSLFPVAFHIEHLTWMICFKFDMICCLKLLLFCVGKSLISLERKLGQSSAGLACYPDHWLLGQGVKGRLVLRSWMKGCLSLEARWVQSHDWGDCVWTKGKICPNPLHRKNCSNQCLTQQNHMDLARDSVTYNIIQGLGHIF